VHPNVVIFLADDAGWGDYSQNGNTQLNTPFIDSIATSGVTLDRFYVCPVCAPTRAEFLTGRYHPRGGVRGVSTGQERLDLNERTLADAFKSAGYATGAFGKWHNGSQWPYHPKARGFDEYFGHTSGHWGEYFDAPLEDNGRMIRTEGYIVDVCTDQAIDFISRNHEKPFFCLIPFTTPHSPWSVPEQYWNRFREKKLDLLATVPKDEIADETRCVLAMMENQDDNVGRVLAKLNEFQIADDTIVLYFSDNGPNSARWTGGMKGKKGTTDEGGVRSTCFIRWPKQLPSGHKVPQIAGAIDLLPTITSLAGIERVGTRPLDGRDLSPLLKQEPNAVAAWSDREIYSTWAGRVSVRTQQFRLDDQGRLFDMVADPGQSSPVNDQYTDESKRLKLAVAQWKQEVLHIAPDSETKNGAKKNSSGRSGGNNAVDPRPFTVGYSEFPITMLPARDAEPHGQIRRSSGAPNCSYFVNWTSLEDRIEWKIDVHTPGLYDVSMDYTCPETDVGSIVQLNFGENKLSGEVTTAWNPPLYTNQDTLPRPHGESHMKEFRTQHLGQMRLNQGIGSLTLKATKIPGNTVMDLRRLTLTLLP
jgi:arylsulfatase A-like enzyme